jgi:hypothetical protein
MRADVVAILLALCLLWLGAGVRADEGDDHFEAKIRPVLVGTCFVCHGGAKISGELRVDSREALVAGGESGPAILPGQPEQSLLIRAIQRHDDVSPMPPEKQQALRADQIADFETWVKQGAAWPAQSQTFQQTRHWAFEPIRDPELPKVQDQAWVQTSVDAFIRAAQESAGVHPAPPADKLTLIRRATFDLIGLPPTPEEIEAFLADASPAAFERVVERLLASRAYGERWGRHWLDVVRYADTAGETADYPVREAWRYRNYVIDAFNTDKPYDEFLREQIAGDILARRDPSNRYAEKVTATGFLAISRRFGFDSENYHHLTIQDTIDTLGQTVLGMSLGCARCHDHKFDPVTMRDYYGLYGIFASSRYAFPGSEQKQKVRCLAPLIPPSEAHAQWNDYAARVAALAERLARLKQPVPAGILKSLNELDGDFEMQAVAAGGSNGVLVPPWLASGVIAVTNAAQSPFKNLYPGGKVGASLPASSGLYRIAQSIFPRRTVDNCRVLYLNLDFRVSSADATATGAHRFALGTRGATPAVEVLISSQSIALKLNDQVETLGSLPIDQWVNLQLDLDFSTRTLSGRVGSPDAVTEFTGKPLAADWSGAIDFLEFDSPDPAQPRPPIEYDNLGLEESPIPPATTELRQAEEPVEADPAALQEQLAALVGIDGDLELQTVEAAPAVPWGPGPNSVVKISTASQSPFCNIFPPGALGIQLPNRQEYDGFGQTLSGVNSTPTSPLSVGFDFRCASAGAGGEGSWRYYLGHGPGSSAAVELYFNGREFFCRSGDAREAIAPLTVGEWYQVQLTLDRSARTYHGSLAWRGGETTFQGQFASGWDGTVDYTFIDSYGHLGGVRPALDADNFYVGDRTGQPLNSPPVPQNESLASRRKQVEEIRRQLAELLAASQQQLLELKSLLIDGPFPLAYAMAEGTPHNERMQLRGEPDQPGEEVPRGFIPALGGQTLPEETSGSGRLELAEWLTQPENPLTARVMVNRIWQQHFGRGLVKTPNDFGLRGQAPTHPDLLDHLASAFLRSHWSVKAMHRLLMRSATYQQASVAEEVQGPADPVDLYASFPRRRLSAEEIRDAILVMCGELDATPGEGHPFPEPISWGFTQHGPFLATYEHRKRSIYLMNQRIKRHPFLALFDGPDPNTTTAQRLATTVPTQALFFLNDPFFHENTERWAARLQAESPDPQQWIEEAHRRAFGRLPSAREREEAAEFLTAYRAELAAASQPEPHDSKALAAYLRTLLGSNAFLFVD